MKLSPTRAGIQPLPRTPGVTRKMVRVHARRVFHDILASRALSVQEWRLVEADLVRCLERKGW